jgi:hypothetical protein
MNRTFRDEPLDQHLSRLQFARNSTYELSP